MDIKIDKTAFFLIALLGVGAVPGAMLLAVWRLTHGFHLTEVHMGEMAAAAISCFAALGILRASLRELAGAIGIVVTDSGIQKSGTTSRVEMSWEQIDTIEQTGVGVLTLRSGNKTIRLSTYLFEKRDKLSKFIHKKTGRTVAEN